MAGNAEIWERSRAWNGSYVKNIKRKICEYGARIGQKKKKKKKKFFYYNKITMCLKLWHETFNEYTKRPQVENSGYLVVVKIATTIHQLYISFYMRRRPLDQSQGQPPSEQQR